MVGAVREPWRNAHAPLLAEIGWSDLTMNYHALDLLKQLSDLPQATLDAMINTGLNTPLSPSCGRLFDAAAAMTGLAWGPQADQGQAAMLLKAALDRSALNEDDEVIYSFNIHQHRALAMPDSEPVWARRALLGDLLLAIPVGTLSARLHRGLAAAIAQRAQRTGRERGLNAVALTGGCLQCQRWLNVFIVGWWPAVLRCYHMRTFPQMTADLRWGKRRSRRCSKEISMCLGIAGQIVENSDVERKLAVVTVSGVRREIKIACILDHRALNRNRKAGSDLRQKVALGDDHPEQLIDTWTLIHVGFATSRINEQEAAETLKDLRMLGRPKARSRRCGPVRQTRSCHHAIHR